MLNSDENKQRLEAILATYLTDGHYNGIAIGVRNVDPMIFKHLADLGLIKTVFPVRGTGETWCLGAYFPKKLSETALRCVEGPKKPKVRIKQEILGKLNIDKLMTWIIEYEGGIYIDFWSEKALLILVHICQYEDVDKAMRLDNNKSRTRTSASYTEQLLFYNQITPAPLWIEQLLNAFVPTTTLKHYSNFQMDINGNKTSIIHNHYLYALCRETKTSWKIVKDLTLPYTWKNTITKIYIEAIENYLKNRISRDDIRLLKCFLGCSKTKPQKGPYNEYILKQLETIEDILSGQNDNGHRRETVRKFRELTHYFTDVRKKSTKTLSNILTREEKHRLDELTGEIKSLSKLVETLCEKGTPIGCQSIIIHLYRRADNL